MRNHIRVMIITVLLMFYPIHVFAVDFSDQTVNYINYYGKDVHMTNGVGIVQLNGEYLLNLYQWQDHRLISKETILHSRSYLYQPKLATIEQNYSVVPYLQDTNGVLNLFLLTNYSGEWTVANQHQPVNLDTDHSVQLFSTLCYGEQVFLAYLQGTTLYFSKYDVPSGLLYHLYNEEVSTKRITQLQMLFFSKSLFFAYNDQSENGRHFRLARIHANANAETVLELDRIQGFDMGIFQNKLYLTYDMNEGEQNRIHLLRSTGDEFTSVGKVVKKDTLLSGVKILEKGLNLRILYREKGFNQAFDLNVVELNNDFLMQPMLLETIVPDFWLTNLTNNVQEISNDALLISPSDSTPIIRELSPSYRTIKLSNTHNYNDVALENQQRYTGLVQIDTAINKNRFNYNLINPTNVVTDGNGQIYLLDSGTSEIRVLDSDGRMKDKWRVTDQAHADITDLTIDPEGYLWMTDAANDRLFKYSKEGKMIQTYGESGVAPGQLSSPMSIAFDSEGNLYILEQGNLRIQKLDEALHFVHQWSLEEVGETLGEIAIIQNRVFVTDLSNHCIQMYDFNGNYIGRFGEFGLAPGKLISPTDLTAFNDKIYVADQGNNRVQVFDSGFHYLYQLGQQGTNWGEFRHLNNIHIDSYGNIYLTDGVNHTLQMIAPDFQLLSGLHGGDSAEIFTSLESISVSGQTYYYWDKERQRLLYYDQQFNFLGEVTLAEQDDRIFAAFTVDNNCIYFTDILNHCVVIYDHKGKLIRVIGGPGGEPGKFIRPQGICIDNAGFIWIADTGNHRIQKFTSDGSLVLMRGEIGMQKGKLLEPQSITCNGSAIYVVDSAFQRVQSYDLNGTVQNVWNGFGNQWDQLTLADYLKQDLMETGFQLMSFSYNLGLSDDPNPAKNKRWLWEDQWGYRYRYVITSNPNDNPTGDYANINQAEMNTGNGHYYLHIQIAKMAFLIPIVVDESPVYHYSAILDNTSPTVTLPVSTSLPQKAVTLSWGSTDNINVAANVIQYKYTLSEIPFTAWDSAKLERWKDLSFGTVQSITVSTGNGTQYLVVQAKDRAGNFSQTAQTSFVMDTNAPEMQTYHYLVTEDKQLQIICSATDQKTSANTLQYRAVVNTSATFLMSGNYQTSGTFLFPYQAGSWYLHVQVRDEAGNESQVYHYPFTLKDISAPTISGLVNQEKPKRSYKWVWEGHDNLDSSQDLHYRYSVTTQPVSSLIGEYSTMTSYELKNVPDGKYYLNVQAIDLDGNQSSIYYAYVYIDNTPPKIFSDQIRVQGTVGSANLYKSVVRVEIPSTAYSDLYSGSQVFYSMNGSTFVPYNTPFEINQDGQTVLTIRVVDAAGNLAESSLTIGIDMTAPILTQPSIDSFNGTWFRTIPNIVISGNDIISGLKSVQYKLNNTEWTSIANGGEVKISPEGRNALDVKLEDQNGNIRLITIPIQNDFTAPIIHQCTSADFPINHWTYHKEGLFKIDATDLHSGVNAYYYLVNTEPLSEPVKEGNYLVSTSNSVRLQAPADGIHYLHIQSVDTAGNIGPAVHYKMMIADEYPATPIIQSDTHPKDGIHVYQNVHFFWATPDAGSLDLVGISGYEYNLKKVENGVETILEAKSTYMNEVTFNDLSILPATSGYYEFSLRAVNSSGRASEPAVYRLNINAPSNNQLMVRSDSHPSNSQYYNTNQLHFLWNHQVDLPNLTYYYQFGLNEQEENWAMVTESEKTITAEYVSTTYYFRVKEVHDNNISSSSVYPIHLDFDQPKVSDFTITLRPTEKNATVYWGNAFDTGGAGIQEIKIRLASSHDDRGWFAVDTSLHETTLNLLQPDETYRLELVVLDRASNQHSWIADLNLQNGVNYDIGEKQEITVAGWPVSLTVLGTQINEAEVALPVEYEFKTSSDPVELLNKMKLTSAEFRDTDFYGKNDEIEYTVNIAGCIYTGKGVELNPNGFHLKQLRLPVPEVFWYNSFGQQVEANKQLIFTNVIIAPKGNHVLGRYLEPKEDCIHDETWDLTIELFELSQSGLGISGSADLTGAFINVPVHFSNILLGTDLTLQSGQLDSGYDLELQGSRLQITHSQLTPDRIVVEEALFHFTDDLGEHAVKLGNFTIDMYGNIMKQENYYSEPFRCTYGGLVYTFAANIITFIKQTLYVREGQVIISGTNETLPLKNVTLQNRAQKIIQGESPFAYLEKMVNGFKLECYDGHLDEGGIVFTLTYISLPIRDDYGKEVVLEVANLRYNLNGTFDFSQVKVQNPMFTFQGMARVYINGISPLDTGLTLTGTVQFNDRMPEGLKRNSFPIKTMNVDAKGGITTLEVSIPTTHPLTLYNSLQFTADTLKFRMNTNLKSVYCTGGAVWYINSMAEKLSYEHAELNILEIENTGKVIKFDSKLRNLEYNLLGLQSVLNLKRIDNRTISFSGFVQLPIVLPGELSGLTLRIYDLVMDHHTGEIEKFSAYLDNFRSIDIAGWKFELYGITFLNNHLKFVAALQIPANGKIAELLPEIAGQYVNINEFVLDNAGNVVGFDVNIPFECEFELAGGILVRAANLGLSMHSGKLNSLALRFAEAKAILPQELGGGTIQVSNLSVNAHGQINYDQIELANETLPFMDVADIYIAHATLDERGLNIQGNVQLGTAFPDGLKGQTFLINKLLITSNGVEDFDIGIDLTKPVNIFNAIEFNAKEFSLSQTGFRITGGTVRCINQLAEMTTSTPVLLNRFEINYSGQIIAFDAGFSDLQFQLFGCTVDVASLNFTKDHVSYMGQVTLPAGLPGQLSGLTLDIATLVISYSGNIVNYRVGLNQPVTFDLNGLLVTVSSLYMDKTGYTMAATCKIPSGSAIPEGLRGVTVNIQNLKFDSNCKLMDFNVNISQTVRFNVDKLVFEITSLTFNNNYLGMNGDIVLPDTFPGTLKSKRISFRDIKMNYHGEFISAQVGITPLEFTLGTYFVATLDGFMIDIHNAESAMSAASLTVKIKSPVNSEIVFENLKLTSKGEFSGTVRPGFTVDIPIAGSTLRIKEPNFSSAGVTVNSAELILPKSVGNQKFAVYNVSISPTDGLRIGGGEFMVKFPNLKVGNVGIQNAYMALKIQSGQYIFEGSGVAQVPGIGQFDTNIKLRSQSSTYPSGIERIYLSFTSSGLGLALGTTGLYINGVYGEFADGPVPDESPAVVKRIGGGMRFNLGVYIRDLSGGLKGDAGFWVNITNSNAAITGKLKLMSDLITTDVYAAITKYFSDFYAEANITILKGTIIGNAGFHIWAENRNTYLTGWSKISIMVKKGQILDYWWIKIPTSDTKIPNLGAEFGDFKGGHKGVKGYIGNLPVIGQVGFFAGNTGFKIGGVSQYVLLDRASAEFKLLTLSETERKFFGETVQALNGNFTIDDKEYISFILPGQDGLPRDSRYVLTATSQELQNYYVQSTDKVIFVVGFEAGNPDLVAIAPDGTRFDKDSAGIEYVKDAHQILMSIPTPKPGRWHIELSEVVGMDYQVAVLGTTPKPELVITSPATERESTFGSYKIQGRGGTFTGQHCYVDLYYDTDGENFDGRLIAERIPLTDFMFNYTWQPNDLPSGEYFIYGKIYDEDEELQLTTEVAYAAGSIDVANYEPVVPPVDLNAVRLAEGVQVHWQKDANPNIAGYRVYFGNTSRKYDHTLDVGLLNQTSLKISEDEEWYICVVAYNQGGAESGFSSEVVVKPAPSNIAQFNLSQVHVPDTIHLYIGEGDELVIPFEVEGFPTGNEGDYFHVKMEGLPEGVYASFDRDVYYLYTTEKEIKVHLITESTTVVAPDEAKTILMTSALPDVAMVEVVFTSVGNPELVLRKQINLTLEHHEPKLYKVDPASGINNFDREITLTGNDFRAGAQIYLNDLPLEILSLEKYEIKARVPAAFPVGDYTVKIQNDDGQFATLKNAYQIVKPSFLIESPQSRVMVLRGGTAWMDLTLKGLNEFTGQVILTSEQIPEGLWVSPSTLVMEPGSQTSLEISASYQLVPGIYYFSMCGKSGDTTQCKKITVEVIDGQLRPTIESFQRPFALTTESHIVYGYGFGLSGTLYLNDKPIPTTSWRSNRIEFIVPVDASSGQLVVEAGGVKSDPCQLIVKEKKYAIYMTPERIVINRGDSLDINFAITGFSDPIQFTICELPVGMSYQFLDPSLNIQPNYDLMCRFNTSSQMPTGEYLINLLGQVGDSVNTFTIPVIIADLPEVSLDEFTEGRVGVRFADKIAIVGGIQPYQIEVLENSLAPGLILQNDGTLTGIPREAGNYSIKIRVTDSLGGYTEKIIHLNVITNEWITSRYDTRRNSLTIDEGPAANDVGFTVETMETPERMVSSEGFIIVGSGAKVLLYTKENGSLVKELDLPGPVSDLLVLREKLLITTMNGNLISYNYLTAEQNKIIDGFTGESELYLYHDQLVILTPNNLQLRNKANLVLEKEFDLGVYRNTTVKGVMDNSLLYFVDEQNNVIGLDLTTGQRHCTVRIPENVTGLQMNDSGKCLIVVAANGTVYSLNPLVGDLNMTINNGKSIRDLIVSEELFIVVDEEGLKRYEKGQLEMMVEGIFHKVLLAGNRLYLTDNQGIGAYKLSNLAQVWHLETGGCGQIIVSNHKLYVTVGNKLYQFLAPTNVYAPQTMVHSMPTKPDGDNGYYRQNVTVYLEAMDRDNEVNATYYALDGNAFEVYTGGIVIGEGEHTMSYYSVDESFKLEKPESDYFKVDYTAPSVRCIADPVDGENGFYISSEVHLSLEAKDSQSGLKGIYYRVDGGEENLYKSSFTVSGDGKHIVEYYADDFAGNRTGTIYHEVNIDTQKPIMSYTLESVDGANGFYRHSPVVVELNAEDITSGIRDIYYQVDGQGYRTYQGHAEIVGDGQHRIEMYAVDLAGQQSLLLTQEVKIDTTPPMVHYIPQTINGRNGYYVTLPVIDHIVGTDNVSGLDQLYYHIDGGTYEIYSNGISTVGEGDHTIEYYGVDKAGNKTSVMSHQFMVDTVLPVLSVTVTPADGKNGYYIKEPVPVTLHSMDATSGVDAVYYQIDQGEYICYQNKAILISGERSHLLTYYAEDTAGNRTEVKQLEVLIDHTAPILKIEPEKMNGKNSCYVTSPVLHTLTATDNVSGVQHLYYRVDQGEYCLYDDGIQVSGDGAHVIDYYGLDVAGNITSVCSHNLQIDTTAPQTQLAHSTPLVNGTVLHLELSATDNFSGVTTIYYRVDNGPVNTTDSDIYLQTAGTHTVAYFAEDSAGNLEEEKQIHCYVKSLEEVSFISDLILTEGNQVLPTQPVYEVDQKITVGELIYLDDKYIFEELPDFLQNARYIRMNRHPVKSSKAYIEFTAQIGLRVYVVTDASINEIPGFTLIGQTRLAKRMQFSNPQNIFMKQVTGNSTIRIPGQKILDTGFAPLIFVQSEKTAHLPFACIEEIKPVQREGRWYLNFTGYGFDFAEGLLAAEHLSWMVTINEKLVYQGMGEAGSVPIDFGGESDRIEITLTVINSKAQQSESKQYQWIEDRSGLMILQPQIHSKVKPGEIMLLQGVLLNELGQPITANLWWEWKHDSAISWQLVGTGSQLVMAAPMQKGEHILRLTDGVRTVTIQFVVQEGFGKGNPKIKNK